MKTFTLTEAKRQLATVLEQAKAGEAIEVTRHGKPMFQFQGGETVIVQRRVKAERTRRTFERVLASMRRRTHKAGARTASALLAQARTSRARNLGIE
ncbi:MAG: type II toxin-antitoxin system prevent-host-death family antitoxin [Betaproteobacteria bacterium]|nr:type II toxin-antitoxin system prevent-host-death family antitoxin [Betaproteobacteria bacterium]